MQPIPRHRATVRAAVTFPDGDEWARPRRPAPDAVEQQIIAVHDRAVRSESGLRLA